MNLRSPLSRVLGSGSAKDGTQHWWSQRLSAVALLILASWFLVCLTRLGSFAYADVIHWAGRPMTSLMLILLALVLAWHSNLGMQVIIEDYVHGKSTKVVALVLSNFTHVFVSLAAVFAVLKISFGAQV